MHSYLSPQTPAKKTLYAILTLLLMLIIFLFSSQPGPASSRLSQKVANAVMKFGFTRDVRKCAHIFLYFCLGTTASLFFDQCMNCTKGLKTLKTAFISIVFCFLYSCSDEWHQTFVAGRSGQLRDIGIDAVGFTLGIMCVLLLKKLTERK